MRCFIAIELPEEVKAELRKAQEQLRKLSGLKASFNKEFHITLKFLGEITPAKVENVKKNLESCRLRKSPVELGSIGIFPNESYIRVVWIGIAPEDEILKLQKQVDEALQKDFPKEKNFKTHMTIARIKYVGDKKRFVKQLQEIEFTRRKFEVASFKLMRSILGGKEGPVYEELASYS